MVELYSSSWWFRFKYVSFSSLFGENSDFDYDFSIGLKPPRSLGFRLSESMVDMNCLLPT